jgi:hypothetical protein
MDRCRDQLKIRTSLGILIFILAFLFLSIVFRPVPSTLAIPAFARKYQTSCGTCHNNYPELNDFGEAFRKNGFKFPKDDETFVKEPPVMLGAQALKEVFPKAVYPGEIPGAIPISFRYSGFFNYNSRQPVNLGVLPRTDIFVPETFALIAAGSFGPNLSFWIDNDISAGGANRDAGLGDGYIKVNDISRYLHLPKDTINIRFGQFELDLPFSQARSINPTDYDIYGQASMAGVLGTTSNPFILNAPQRGIEIGGYPNDGNFSWSVALVNGSNDSLALRNTKDVYVRVSQRFNLERDPKLRKEVQVAGPTGPHDHTSIRFGGFYYYGKNSLNIDQTLFPQLGALNEPFYRVGGDFRFKYRNNFEVYGLGMHGHDINLIPNEDASVIETGSPVTFTGGFVQAQYWFYPWFIGILRYDVVNSPTDFLNNVSRSNTRNRFSPGIQLLIRANIKTIFEYQHRWEQSTGLPGEFYRPNGAVVGVDYAF